MTDSDPSDFDAYAEHYGEALSRGISVSGESKEYFAQGRVALLARRLAELGVRPVRVMDYGCGTGTATPFLRDILGSTSIVGVDISGKSIEHARAHQPGAEFHVQSDVNPAGDFDAVYCNGVFHHIPPPERLGAFRFIRDCLRPGGVFALWENNPWNPGTQLVMARIPFDRDAVKISAPAAGRLLRAAGLDVIRTDFYFIFPHRFRALRFLEAPLARVPLGAQYQVLARNPQRRPT
ncbi:MAG: methyltransferase domain-containing protein [bacterium]